MNRCDIGSDGKTPLQGCMGEGTTHRFWNLGRRSCTCLPNQQGEYPLIAELVIGSSCCHRARVGDRNTCGERQENASVAKMGRGANTRKASGPVVPRRQLQRVRHSSRNGRAPLRSCFAPGEFLTENKAARTYLRRSHFDQWGLSEGCLGWTRATASSQRSMPEGN